MGAEISPPCTSRSLLLLEFAAMDDLDSFKGAVEDSKFIDQSGLWYTRHVGSKSYTMSYQLRTPLMVAAQYGSVSVLEYIIHSGKCDVNRVLGSDQVTALHCAIAGGSQSAPTVVDRLISASAQVDSRVAELVSCFPKFMKQQRLELETLLLPQRVGSGYSLPEPEPIQSPQQQQQQQQQPGSPVLPDINNGVYSTDEFRMYCFKIVPCSRAYTHDWTECPFAHPGENAKRRDPKKHPYTCVPCPEFKKGSCRKGDDCEFAHGVFESWLHPAQYRTRLCKDEIGCARKVCFFAHKKEELRPVYQSTGSAIPGPEMGNNTNSVGLSTPPMSPSFSPKGSYSPTMVSMGGPPPNLQLPGSRLRSSLSARDVDFGRELMKIEQQYLQQQQQQVHSPRPSPRPTNLDSVFASINVSRKLSPPREFDSSPKSLAAAMLNSRSAAFAKRSQSFIDRAAAPGGGYGGAPMSDWGSPNGKLEWGMKGEELNKLRKSNSFGFRGSNNVDGVGVARTGSPPGFNEPDVSWVNSLVKDEVGPGFFVNGGGRHRGGGGGGGKGGQVQPWVEQLYIEQEQLVA